MEHLGCWISSENPSRKPKKTQHGRTIRENEVRRSTGTYFGTPSLCCAEAWGLSPELFGNKFLLGFFFWLVVSTHLKNISQNGNLPQIGVKIKNVWNHHLVLDSNLYPSFFCSLDLVSKMGCPSTNNCFFCFAKNRNMFHKKPCGSSLKKTHFKDSTWGLDDSMLKQWLDFFKHQTCTQKSLLNSSIRQLLLNGSRTSLLSAVSAVMGIPLPSR